MATVTIKSGGIGIDTSDFRGLAKAIRAASPGLATKLRTRLRAAGQIVADEAKSIASENSKTIPPTIRVSAAGLVVSILAGGGDKPLPGLFELGNQGRGGGGGTFRHPVFGNKDVWVSQSMHPFLLKAAQNKKAELDVAVTAALDDVIKEITFTSG